MTSGKILVLSGRKKLLDTLTALQPDRFVASPTACVGDERVAVIDADSLDRIPQIPGSIQARLILHDGAAAFPERRDGDLRIAASIFEQDPVECLAWAEEMASSRSRCAVLEREMQFSRKARDLLSDADLESIFEKVASSALELLGLVHGTLLFYDSEQERYEVQFTNDPDYEDTGGFVPGVPRDLLNRSLEGAKDFAVRAAADGCGILLIPLRVGDDLIGVFRAPIAVGQNLDRRKADHAAAYFSAVTGALIHARQMSRSYDLVLRDDLTKAYNRRFFDSYLKQEIERSRRYGTGFSIIFLDLDDLKNVNNRYGHLMGSRTLQEVAKRMLAAVRSIDRIVRFGGDEFCIILPQTDETQARAVGQRVREAIAGRPFRLEPGVEVEITASFGIANFPRHATSKEELIRVADAAMYRVKSTTKNSIEIASEHE